MWAVFAFLLYFKKVTTIMFLDRIERLAPMTLARSPRTIRNTLLGVACLPLTMSAMACELLDALDPPAYVQVSAVHHGTPRDGVFPNQEIEDNGRLFQNDLGWTVYLYQAFISHNGVSLVSCDGEQHNLAMNRGPIPDSIEIPDLEGNPVTMSSLPSGDYCKLRVSYGPWQLEGNGENWAPGVDAAAGATVYMTGFAIKNGKSTAFEIHVPLSLDVELDISEIDNGDPLALSGELGLAERVTLSKTYDRFFDGTDFNALDLGFIQDHVLATLEEDTRAFLGNIVRPE